MNSREISRVTRGAWGDGVPQLLVEGGASTYKAFHDLGLVNEYQLF